MRTCLFVLTICWIFTCLLQCSNGVVYTIARDKNARAIKVNKWNEAKAECAKTTNDFSFAVFENVGEFDLLSSWYAKARFLNQVFAIGVYIKDGKLYKYNGNAIHKFKKPNNALVHHIFHQQAFKGLAIRHSANPTTVQDLDPTREYGVYFYNSHIYLTDISSQPAGDQREVHFSGKFNIISEYRKPKTELTVTLQVDSKYFVYYPGGTPCICQLKSKKSKHLKRTKYYFHVVDAPDDSADFSITRESLLYIQKFDIPPKYDVIPARFYRVDSMPGITWILFRPLTYDNDYRLLTAPGNGYYQKLGEMLDFNRFTQQPMRWRIYAIDGPIVRYLLNERIFSANVNDANNGLVVPYTQFTWETLKVLSGQLTHIDNDWNLWIPYIKKHFFHRQRMPPIKISTAITYLPPMENKNTVYNIKWTKEPPLDDGIKYQGLSQSEKTEFIQQFGADGGLYKLTNKHKGGQYTRTLYVYASTHIAPLIVQNVEALLNYLSKIPGIDIILSEYDTERAMAQKSQRIDQNTILNWANTNNKVKEVGLIDWFKVKYDLNLVFARNDPNYKPEYWYNMVVLRNYIMVNAINNICHEYRDEKNLVLFFVVGKFHWIAANNHEKPTIETLLTKPSNLRAALKREQHGMISIDTSVNKLYVESDTTKRHHRHKSADV